MELREFIDFTINSLDETYLSLLKEALIGKYIDFSFVDESNITQCVFAEKVYDYFHKLELRTKSNFEDILHVYMNNWDSLIGKRIAKESATKKGETPLPMPRSRKYYIKLEEIKKSKDITRRQIVDFSRISMCLYAATIKAKFEEISDFDLSIKVLEMDKLILAMKEEKPNKIVGIAKKQLFDLTDPFSLDTGIFVFTIVMYAYIKYMDVERE